MNKKNDPDRMVVTAFDKSAKRSECRFIKGKFYKMNEECFKFDGRWYRTDSGFIIKDASTGKWILKDSDDVICGLILNSKRVVETGYFIKDLFKNIPVHTKSLPSNLVSDVTISGKTAYAFNMDVIKSLRLVEDIASGIFMSKELASKKIAIKGNYGFPVDYSFEDSGEMLKEAYHQYKKTMNPKSKYSELLNGITFGWEFETTDGYVHPRYLIKTGLIPLRDGSISGFEYVTCPLKGKIGLDTTIESAEILSRYTTKNISCSLHLHIGNIPITKEYITDFFKVCRVVEDDIFSMFPEAMSHTSKYKSRDYCNKLPKISSSISGITFGKIINWVSGQGDYYPDKFRGFGNRTHPNDEGGHRKYNVGQRYLWVNIVPYIFSKRGTVEFRIHTPTTNPTKLINWLYICAAIVNFTKNYAPSYTNKDLETLTLKKIIKIVYKNNPEIANYLNDYISFRVKFMDMCYSSGDDIGNIEIMNDLEFEYPYRGKTTFVDE